MVGVGAAEGAPPEPYYGEYYAPAPPPEQYYVPPEMCPHPQHPQHPHMCTVHTEYGGMPVVTSATMMPPMIPPVLDENMRHYVLAHPHPHQHPHHQPHHQPPHHQPPHHQPPHHYGPANGAGGPQHFYGGGYTQHFHVPPHHMQHSPPPPVYQKDERAQRQYSKLKQKLERKQTNRNNGIEINSGASTPSLSPRKEMNGRGSGGASSGAWSEGEGSSAGASVAGDDDDTQAVLDLLSATRTPRVSDMTPTSALVQWNSPLPEGVTLPDVELTYDLLLGDRGRYKAIYSGPSLSCRVRDLRPGCEYSVCLQIRAGGVTGAASAAATFTAPPAPPARVAPPRVSQRARTTLLLRWHAAPDNGARFLHYVLQVADDDGAWSDAARPRTRQHSLVNLKPQTRYRFRVAAVNECGRAEWSDEAVAWTSGAPPDAPPPPALARAERTALQLAWEPAADCEFTLQMDDPARRHGFLPIYSGPDTAHLAADLRRATAYRFRLRSENADGPSPWSADVTYSTLAEPPAPPGRPQTRGKPHARALRLRWEPPLDDGGAPVDRYTLELDAGDGFREAYSGAAREAACERLRPGTAYRARVRCANEAGDSAWSAEETVATDVTAPGACGPPELASPARPTQLHVRWRPPECCGGAPLVEYRVEAADEADDEPPATVAAAGSEALLCELRPGRRYRVTVTAVSRVGAGPASPALHTATPAAPPAAPADLTVVPDSPRSARLEWSEPAGNGAPVLDYRLEMAAAALDDAFAEVYRGAAPACAVAELTPFSPYLFRVCARNAAGRGAWSRVRELLTPRAPPAAPLAVRAEAAGDALRVWWRAPAAHGADVLRYRVLLDDAAYDTEGPEPERVLRDLPPDTQYRVRVAALSELGLGEWSAETRAHTRPPPPAPPALRVTHAAHSCLKLEWEASGDGAAYCVEMRAEDARDYRPVYRGSARWCRVKKLREASEYWFRVRASDERGGRGAWGEAVCARTPGAPPPPPRAPAASLAGRGVLAEWDAEDGDVELQLARGTGAGAAGGAGSVAWRVVYAGRDARHSLPELEAGEWLLRVVRRTVHAESPAASPAASPATRLTVPHTPPAPRTRRRAVGVRISAGQAALLLAALFLLLAVLVAVLLQRLVERP